MGMAGQELSQETNYSGTVTIATVEVACSTSGYQVQARNGEHGEGVIANFRVTLRIRREVLAAAEVDPAGYQLGEVLLHRDRELMVMELIDREELPYIVIRGEAPGLT